MALSNTTLPKAMEDLFNQKLDASKVLANLTTTQTGFALDASMGRELKAQIDTLNSKIINLPTSSGETESNISKLFSVMLEVESTNAQGSGSITTYIIPFESFYVNMKQNNNWLLSISKCNLNSLMMNVSANVVKLTIRAHMLSGANVNLRSLLRDPITCDSTDETYYGSATATNTIVYNLTSSNVARTFHFKYAKTLHELYTPNILDSSITAKLVVSNMTFMVPLTAKAITVDSGLTYMEYRASIDIRNVKPLPLITFIYVYVGSAGTKNLTAKTAKLTLFSGSSETSTSSSSGTLSPRDAYNYLEFYANWSGATYDYLNIQMKLPIDY